MRLVRVVWEDAHSTDAWTPRNELDDSAPLCTTVGFLVKDDGKVVSVASTFQDNDVCCVMHIPSRMIVETHDL